MNRQLPGLRWDDDRQRYFADPRPLPVPVPVPPAPYRPPTSYRAPYRALSDLRSVCSTAHKDALVHHVQSSQIPLTDDPVRTAIPVQGAVSAFQTVSHNGRAWSFAGDTAGWFYSSVPDQNSDVTDPWQPQHNLTSQVSSIVTSPTACVATSFGPDCRVLFLPFDSPVDGVHILRFDSRIVHDVWTTDILGSRLVLGANKQAVVILHTPGEISLQRLPTESDVLALAQRENIVYTGLRNGDILRFDTRVRGDKNNLFGAVSERKSSIIGLRLLRDHRLLASFIDGAISTFDLRFPVRTPLTSYTGNVNSYTLNLPLVTDPYEKFLFAAGQDNRIRSWSLDTGGPALGTGNANLGAFERPFEHQVAALQAVEDGGMCLWAASGAELCKYRLGRRSTTGI